jgi:prepilin-type N-terminal cleavage/methylation domain-containing protein
MNTQRTFSIKRGFTLMELMVAMAITTIIVTVLVSITSIALDTWNRSRSELRASRQAKGMIDTMARDFEALVTRRGNTNEWLSAITESQKIGDKLESTNASKLIFFTAATDRYNGEIGKAGDLGGDVSCVAYGLEYKDPIGSAGAGFETFVLNRLLVNPDETFNKLLGKTDLTAELPKCTVKLDDPTNFVCENIYQFTITFHVQVSQASTGASPVTTIVNVPVKLGKTNANQTTNSFKIKGTGIESGYAGGTVTNDELKGGRITAMEVSATVISDFGVDQLKRRTFSGSQQAEFLAKNSYQYTKLVQLPSM